MAASETLELLVNLRGDGSKGLRTLDADLRKTQGTAKQTATVFDSLKSTIASVGVALGATFAVGTLVSLVKSAITVFAEFDDTMRQVKAISGATNEEFKEMSDLAKKMGDTTRFTATDSAKTLRILSQAGFSVAESMKALPSVMTLASAGMVDLSQAADIAGNAMNSYGLTAEALPSINNVLVRAINQTNADLSDLGTAFKYVAPIAKALGADFEDLVGAMGLLHNAGIKAETAGTSLRGILDALFTPTKDEAEMMEVLSKRIGGAGLQIRDSQGNFIGFLALVQQLEKAGMRGEEALRLFGARAGPGMAALLNMGSEKLASLNGFLRETGDLAGKTAKEMESGIGGAIRELESALEGIQIAFGDAFGDDLKQIIIKVKDEVLKFVQVLKDAKEDGSLVNWGRDLTEILDKITTAFEIALSPIIGWGRAINWAAQQWKGFSAVMHEEMSTKTFVMGNYETVMLQLREIARAPELTKLRVKLKEVEDQIQKTKEGLAQPTYPGTDVTFGGVNLKSEKDKLVELEAEWKKLLVQIAQYGKTSAQLGENTGRAFGEDSRAAREDPTGIRNIGRAGAKPGKPPAAVETDTQKKARDAAAKAAMDEAAAIQKEYLASIEQAYAIGLVVFKDNVEERARLTNEFYEKQKQAARDATTAEIAELEKLAKKAAPGTQDRIKAEGEIVQKRRELSAELIRIETQRYQEEVRLAEEAKEKKIAIENAMADIRIRMQVSSMAPGVDREFTEEKLRMDEKHRLEMEALKKLTEDKANWNELARTQELEAQRLHEDQVIRLRAMQLDAAKQVASGVADLFQNMYEASGKQVKAFFYVAKAAAMAEATMNIAQGVTKAIAQGGWWGVIQGAAVAAAGMAQLARISSQQLAAGGLVEGHSPSTKADDKLIAATSGEYMHPVKAVRHYGLGFMNAVRNLQFPKDLSSQFASRFPSASPTRSHFADGGMVGSQAGLDKADPKSGVEIINFVDPHLMGQYMATVAGKRQIVNIIAENAPVIKGALFSNG